MARACVPRLLSRLYPRVVYVFVTHSSLLVEFDLSYIKHVLTVWPFTLTSACLVTKHFPFGQALTLVSFFLFLPVMPFAKFIKAPFLIKPPPPPPPPLPPQMCLKQPPSRGLNGGFTVLDCGDFPDFQFISFHFFT